MTDLLTQGTNSVPAGASTTAIGPKNAAEFVSAGARLLDPSIMPGAPTKLEKIGLPDMAYWLMDLRLKLRFRGGINAGTDADFAVIELTASDATMLERIVDSLNYLARERQRPASTKTQPRKSGASRR